MTNRPPHREGREPLWTLRSIRQIRPAADVAGRAIERALAAARQAEAAEPQRNRWKEIIVRSGLAAAVVSIIVGTVWLVSSGPSVVAAPTWADVTRQAIGVDRVHIDFRAVQGSNMAQQRMEIWIQTPGIIRSKAYQLVDGELVATECSIATPTAAVRWNERTKLGEYTSTGNQYMVQSSAASTFEAMIGVSLFADRPEMPITINGETVKFVAVAEKHPADPTLRGYKLANKNPTGPPLVPPLTSLVYWFAERANSLRRLTMTMGEGEQAQRSDMILDFHPSIPAGWFDVKLPTDCSDVRAGVRPRLTPELRQIYDHVAAARKRFGDYRAVMWRDHTGGWPSFREATRGERWRCDTVDWTVMHTAMLEGNRQGFVKIGPDDPFAKLWEQVNRPDCELTISAMTWQDKLAFVNYGQVAAQLMGAMKSGYETFFAPSIHMTAWPEWMWWENLEPHGLDLNAEPLQWRMGPVDPEHPEWVHVIGTRSKGHYVTIRYTLDRSKDWLCVRQEWEINPTAKRCWEVTECARTADGLWYPRKAIILGSRYEYAVERQAGEPGFFDYPAGMPQPTDPFAEMMASLNRSASQPASAPE